VFSPLGMTSSHITDDFTEVFPGLANAYVRSGGSLHLAMPRFEIVGGSGLITSVADLAKWDAEFVAAPVGGRGLVDSLLRRGVLTSGDTIDYAAGLQYGQYRGRITIEHDGGYGGYVGDMMRFPDAGLSSIVLCNVRTNPKPLARRIADIFLDERDATIRAETQSPRAPSGITANLAHLPPGGRAPTSALYYDRISTDLFRVSGDSSTATLTVGTTASELHADRRGAYVDARSGDAWVFSPDARRLDRYRGTRRIGSAERVGSSDATASSVRRFEGKYTNAALQITVAVQQRQNGLVLVRWRAPDVMLEPQFAGAFSGDGFLYRFLGSHADSLEISDDRLRSVVLLRQGLPR
jgi:hypothetical protein